MVGDAGDMTPADSDGFTFTVTTPDSAVSASLSVTCSTKDHVPTVRVPVDAWLVQSEAGLSRTKKYAPLLPKI
jgi:hypothetical protein